MYTDGSFSHSACAHMPGAHVWIHTDKGCRASTQCYSCRGPSRASPGGIAGGTIAKITNNTDHREAPTQREPVWGHTKHFLSIKPIKFFSNEVSALHGEPAGTCSTALQPTAHIGLFGIPEKAERARTAEGWFFLQMFVWETKLPSPKMKEIKESMLIKSYRPAGWSSACQWCSSVEWSTFPALWAWWKGKTRKTRRQEIHLAASQTGVWQQHPRL